MATQNNSDRTDSRSARRSFWQRLSPFLDVLGAVLIFGSWILSHALSQQAADRAGTHDDLLKQVRQFRLYDDFTRRISEIQSDLLRTRNLVEQPDNDASDGVRSMTPEALTWTGLRPQQLRLGRSREHEGRRSESLCAVVWLDPGPSTRPFGRPDWHRWLPRLRRDDRPGSDRLRRVLRRSGRARPRGFRRRSSQRSTGSGYGTAILSRQEPHTPEGEP